MSTPIPEGLGKCAICLRTVHQTDSISSVLRGRPPRAYICHQDCKKHLEAQNGPEPQLTQADYMGLAPEPESWIPLDDDRERMREDLRIALKEDFGDLIATVATGGAPVVDDLTVKTQVEPETPSSEPTTSEPSKKAPPAKKDPPDAS